MINQISSQELVNEVTRLANTYPNTIYNKFVCQVNGVNNYSCCYTIGTAGGKQGCLIGQAILNLRPEYKDLLSMFDKYMSEIGGINSSIGSISSLIISDYSPNNTNIKWLSEVQGMQDNNKTWSQAIYQDLIEAKVDVCSSK